MEKKYLDIINNALSDDIARKVAIMMATSHEYKVPDIDGALALVKNYKWTETTMKISNLQGIDKPVIKEKVFNIAEGIKKNNNKVEPFIVVNKLHGVYPQSLGKKILLDGHHRKEACELLGLKAIPVYLGVFTGNAQKSKQELKEKEAHEMNELLEKLSAEKQKSYENFANSLDSLEKIAGVSGIAKSVGANVAKGAGAVKNKVIDSARKTGLGSALYDYNTEATKLKKMKDLGTEAVRTGNKAHADIAKAGIKEFSQSKDFMGAVVKDEAKKLGGKAMHYAPSALLGLNVGAVAVNQANKKKEDKTAAEALNDFAKLAEMLNAEDLEVIASDILERMDKEAGAIKEIMTANKGAKAAKKIVEEAARKGDDAQVLMGNTKVVEHLSNKAKAVEELKGKAKNVAKHVGVGAGATAVGAKMQSDYEKKNKTASEMLNDFIKLSEVLTEEELEVVASEVLESLEKQAGL